MVDYAEARSHRRMQELWPYARHHSESVTTIEVNTFVLAHGIALNSRERKTGIRVRDGGMVFLNDANPDDLVVPVSDIAVILDLSDFEHTRGAWGEYATYPIQEIAAQLAGERVHFMAEPGAESSESAGRERVRLLIWDGTKPVNEEPSIRTGRKDDFRFLNIHRGELE